MFFSMRVKILFIKDNNTIEFSFNLGFVWYWRENYCFSLKVIAYFQIHGFVFIIELEFAWLSLCFQFIEAEVCSAAMRNMIMMDCSSGTGISFFVLVSCHSDPRLPLDLKIHTVFSKIGQIWSRFWCSSNENSI